MKPAKEVAKEIRKELKQKFPNKKFSVRTNRSGLDSSIRIRWTDYPTRDEVEKVVKPFENVSRCEVTGDILLGGNLYIFADNEWEDETRKEVEAEMPEGIERGDFNYWPQFNRTAQQIYKDRYQRKIEQQTQPKQGKRKIKNPEDPATYKQKMALIGLLGLDKLTKDQASQLIQKGKSGVDIFTDIQQINQTETTPKRAERKEEQGEYVWTKKGEKRWEEVIKERGYDPETAEKRVAGEPATVTFPGWVEAGYIVKKEDWNKESAYCGR